MVLPLPLFWFILGRPGFAAIAVLQVVPAFISLFSGGGAGGDGTIDLDDAVLCAGDGDLRWVRAVHRDLADCPDRIAGVAGVVGDGGGGDQLRGDLADAGDGAPGVGMTMFTGVGGLV